MILQKLRSNRATAVVFYTVLGSYASQQATVRSFRPVLHPPMGRPSVPNRGKDCSYDPRIDQPRQQTHTVQRSPARKCWSILADLCTKWGWVSHRIMQLPPAQDVSDPCSWVWCMVHE